MLKSNLLAGLGMFGVAIMMCGCSTLGSLNSANVPAAPAINEAGELYLVEMQTPRGARTQFKGQIQKSPITTIQTALEESGAVENFQDMEITVYRKVPGSGSSLKMPVEYKPANDAVDFRQDYALHHGDRIVIKPKSGGAMGQLLDSLTNSF